MITRRSRDNTEYIVRTICRQYIKKLKSLKWPYTAFWCLYRPNSQLVTPKRCASIANDHNFPGSSCLSSVFCSRWHFPIGLYGDGGSIAGSLHGHEYHLGLKVQVSFKGEWACTYEESADKHCFTWEQVMAQPDSQIWLQPSLHNCNRVKTTA